MTYMRLALLPDWEVPEYDLCPGGLKGQRRVHTADVKWSSFQWTVTWSLKHESFEEAPALYQDPTYHCHGSKTNRLHDYNSQSTMAFPIRLLFKIVSNSFPGPISLPQWCSAQGNSTGGGWDAEKLSRAAGWLTGQGR